MTLDLLIISPSAKTELYQTLGNTLSAIEPPLWSALLAAFVRMHGYTVSIVDAEIEPEKVLPVIRKENPRLIAVVVSGTNPSASTMNMTGARHVLEEIVQNHFNPTILIGLHPSALPLQTIVEEPVNMVCHGEGFYTLLDLLEGKQHEKVRGLYYTKSIMFNTNESIEHTPKAALVDLYQLPMPAWDLLPMDKYRAHNWHCFGHLDERIPYGVIYTSLGCPYNCSFCCINSIYGGPGIRYREPSQVIIEIDYLVKHHGIKNIKILDECFVLNKQHVIDICNLIIERDYDLNIWAYARIDTVDEHILSIMKQAGFKWLAYGIETADNTIRNNVHKGKFTADNVRNAVRITHEADIHIIGNYIFGLPNETRESMSETLKLATELNCEYANFYTAMAYPGSQLYEDCISNNVELPKTWSGYSQHGNDTLPLSTDDLSSEHILYFRDKAFESYHKNPNYLNMIKEKFGYTTVKHINDMVNTKIERTQNTSK